MSLGEMFGKLNLARQIQKEIKEPGFSFKVMAIKSAKTVGWGLAMTAGIAGAGWLMNTPAVTDALKHAGLSDAMAVAVAGGLLWIGRSITNAIANSKQAASPVDGQPVNVQAAEKSGPVFTTEEQFDAFTSKYKALRDDNIPFDEARKLAMQLVTGLEPKQ